MEQSSWGGDGISCRGFEAEARWPSASNVEAIFWAWSKVWEVVQGVGLDDHGDPLQLHDSMIAPQM